jgi:hypothetical protein
LAEAPQTLAQRQQYPSGSCKWARRKRLPQTRAGWSGRGLRGQEARVVAVATVLAAGKRGEMDDAAPRLLELRCECGHPNCRATLPSLAETFRGRADRRLVMPAHSTGERVVRAADRFFVVERA